MSRVCPAGRSASIESCLARNFNVGYYTKMLVIRAMVIGTIDFYRIIPLSLTLTLPGVTRSVQSNPSFGFLFSCTL